MKIGLTEPELQKLKSKLTSYAYLRVLIHIALIANKLIIPSKVIPTVNVFQDLKHQQN